MRFSVKRTDNDKDMIEEYQLRVLPETAANEQAWRRYGAREKGKDERTLTAIRVLKRSIDARQRTIFVNLKLRVYVNEQPEDDEFVRTAYRNVEGRPQVVVVGAGPGGLFAALRLIEAGYRPVIVERGKNVRDRKLDLAKISREHKVDSESNYSFGEGGAGAYSDGKLYTRSKKRGNAEKILNVFCQHGASVSILQDAHPHIGTDKLPRVIENMRKTILDCGGEVHFGTRMDVLLIEKDTVVGIETNTGKTFRGPVILATGHSARDVYRWLHTHGVEIESYGLAVGVRLEHPSLLIDQIQYHNRNGRGKYLPAAEYSFVQQVEGRGVYSFCMCPGGFVVPAASGPRQTVVNGMSPSNRGSKWSNSGMVVEIRPEDYSELMKHEGEITGRFYGCFRFAAGRASSVGHDVLSGSLGRTELAAGKLPADGSRATDGRFRERAFELRPAREFVCPRTGVLAFAFLDAEVHHGTVGRGLPPFRQSLPWFPDQRGRDDRSGEPYVGTRTYRARRGNFATRAVEGIVPVR